MINTYKTLSSLLHDDGGESHGERGEQFTKGEPPLAVEELLKGTGLAINMDDREAVRLIELVEQEQEEESIVPTPPESQDAPWSHSQPWLEPDVEGQLAVDVYQTSHAIVVRSPIAGVDPADIDVTLHHDLLTIRGKRAMQEDVDDEQYFYRECHWGSFSRSFILPAEVNPQAIEARFHRGVLTIVLPKLATSDRIPVIAEDDDGEIGGREESVCN